MALGVEAIIEAVLAAAPRGHQSAALCTKADALVASGDSAAALACFDRALRLDVTFARAWVGRAVILREGKRDNEALGCLHRALDVDPQCASALVQKAHILRARGHHQEALEIYEAALSSGAKEDARAGRDATLRALGQTEGPRRADPRAEKVSLRRDPRAEKASLRRDPRAEKASIAIDPVVAKKSDPAVAKKSDPVVAKKSNPVVALSAPRSNAPRLTQTEEDLATLDEVHALCLAGRALEALRKLEPITRRCPSEREVWTLRGHILVSLGQYDPALASVERAAKLDPKDPDVLKLMVKVLAATGKDVRALEAAERLVAVAPRDVEVHRIRADCLVAAMRHVEAVAAYEKVIQFLPDDPSGWLALGRTLRQLRRGAEARMALTRALALAEEKHAPEAVALARELLAKLPADD